MNGMVSVITGAAGGIGKAIAYRLAEAGSRVIIADNSSDLIHETAREFEECGFMAHPYVLDISDEGQVSGLVSFASREFGGIDILVNNAGVFPSNSLFDMSSSDFKHVIDINLMGVFYATSQVARLMKGRGGGKIINITSVDALRPSSVGLAHYDSSKHAVWGFTKSAALEYAKYNISVNAVAPGGVATPGVEALLGGEVELDRPDIPMGRIGNPDEIATAVLFLASSMSSYMTGEQIVVDGGLMLT